MPMRWASSRWRSGRFDVGLLGWLTVLFVGLKLTGVIAWSWWLVLLPALLPLALAAAFWALTATAIASGAKVVIRKGSR